MNHSSYFFNPFYDFFFSSDNTSLRPAPALKKLVRGIAYKKKKPCRQEKKKYSMACLSGTVYLFVLGGILPPNPHEKKKNIKSCRLSEKP